MATRRELKDAIRERYQAAMRLRERRQILSEFVRVIGYHRKHVLRVLNQPRRRHLAQDIRDQRTGLVHLLLTVK
jgi:hypothetical protein